MACNSVRQSGSVYRQDTRVRLLPWRDITFEMLPLDAIVVTIVPSLNYVWLSMAENVVQGMSINRPPGARGSGP